MLRQLWFTKNVTFCGNSSYGEILNNGIQEGKSYHVNLKTFLIRVSTHPKKMMPSSLLLITCTKTAPASYPKVAQKSHPPIKNPRYVFQVRLDVQDKPRGNSQPQRLLNLVLGVDGSRLTFLGFKAPVTKQCKFHLLPPPPATFGNSNTTSDYFRYRSTKCRRFKAQPFKFLPLLLGARTPTHKKTKLTWDFPQLPARS